VAAVPVPVKNTACGLLLALSLKLSVPVLEPVDLGEKVTKAVQLAPAASVLGLSGQFEVKGKSLAVLVMLVIFNEEDWLSVRVTS